MSTRCSSTVTIHPHISVTCHWASSLRSTRTMHSCQTSAFSSLKEQQGENDDARVNEPYLGGRAVGRDVGAVYSQPDHGAWSRRCGRLSRRSKTHGRLGRTHESGTL